MYISDFAGILVRTMFLLDENSFCRRMRLKMSHLHSRVG